MKLIFYYNTDNTTNDHFIARYKRYVSNSMSRAANSFIMVKPELE